MINESTKKTDKHDASTISEFLSKDMIPESYLCNKETENLRRLLKSRERLVRSIVGQKNEIHALLGSNHYRIVLYGKIIFSFRMFQKKFWIQDILGTLKTWASYNLFYFTDEFRQNIEYLNEKQQEQTREAYQFLYHYYTKIEPDKKQAFHWLKKLSFYGIQGELRSLAKCYANGDGCEVDRILGDKLLDIIDKQRIYRYYGWEKNKF